MTGGSTSLLDRLRTAGIDPSDSDDLRLNKSLLMFATGLASVASMLWLVIYWSLGPQLSSTLPFAFQMLLAINLAVYIKWGNFDFFRLSQLSLFLFFPFVVQWSIGNFITASGITIWGLLAPVGAILFFGVREAFAWFIAYLFLLADVGLLRLPPGLAGDADQDAGPHPHRGGLLRPQLRGGVDHRLPAAALRHHREAEGPGAALRSPPPAADRAGALGAPAAQHPARHRWPSG
jgi:hypothetical protein